MISVIEQEVVEKRNWITSDEMLDILAIAESTPGPVSINVSTFVGFKKFGFIGAIASTIGVVIPPFLIIFCISFVVEEFKNNLWISYAFKGIRVAALVLILNAVLKMFKKYEKSIFGFVVIIFTLCICFLTNIILMCAVLGIAYKFIENMIKLKRAATPSPENIVDEVQIEEDKSDDIS
jgi:chromate transporter